ncbi:MAG TPA: hypothetical protein DF409_09760, partial [Bacteroidales bacterium]|nr:hypothetical protein [Bacteroidales bacterium]
DLRIYNPADKIRLPKKPVIQGDELGDIEEGQLFISSVDMDRFFSAAINSWFFRAYELMSLTGMRPSEILGLKWEDINKMIRPRRAITDYG